MTEDEYAEIIMNALKQIEYDIYCLDDNAILVLNRIIHGYLISQGKFSQFTNKGEKE